MRRRTTGTAVLAILAAVAAVLTMAVPGQAAPRGSHPTHGPGAFRHGRYAPMHGRSVKAGCATSTGRGFAVCDARLLAAQPSGRTGPLAMSAPTGYGPADIQSAYHLTDLDGAGRTVAIVDAGDDPKAESDLATYRNNFGLPACTTANGCFEKLNQTGVAGSYPKADYSWAEESSLDLDMVSAACPTCHIVLVEANSASTSDLSAAEDTAAAEPGVVAVSNSFGDPEPDNDTAYNQHFIHRGVTTVASTGDTGNQVNWPSSVPSVTAAGGTSLTKDSSARGWTETAWSGAGSGCSKTQQATGFQPQIGSCTMRETADVSAVADPNTGVAIYDTAASCGSGSLCNLLISLGLAKGATGWVQVGGTSAASPIIASVYALAGDGGTNAKLYNAPAGSLNDVTSGSNGSCGNALCTAGPGYDGPTGMGTPNGVGAF